MFANGRYSDRCDRGRANNAAIGSRQHAAELRVASGLVRAAYLTVHPDARLLTLQLPMSGTSEPPTCGRGNVSGMSDESRRRLMVLLHTIKRSARNPAFVTLTFPDSDIPTPREAKRMLQMLFKRWKRRCPQLCAIWRVEAHPERSWRLSRPVPHFHLLVWGAWIDRFELSRDWAEVVNSETQFTKHLASGTNVDGVRSFRGVCYYASKYISKREESSLGDDAGRIWGVFNRDALPVGESFTVRIENRDIVKVVRYLRKLLASRNVETEWMPTNFYCERPADVLRVLSADSRSMSKKRVMVLHVQRS